MKRLFCLCLLVLSTRASDKGPHEAVFPGVIFGPGGEVSVKIVNKSVHQRDITVQRYSSDGTARDTVSRRVAGQSTISVRIAAASDRPEFGWVRVLDRGRGNPSDVSITEEHSSGIEFTSITNTPVFPHPLSEKAIRYALHRELAVSLRDGREVERLR